MVICLGEAQAFFNGRAEPAPPRGGPSKLGRPSGANPGITVGAVFSEGRGLRARVARPDASRGIPTGWVDDEPVAKRRQR